MSDPRETRTGMRIAGPSCSPSAKAWLAGVWAVVLLGAVGVEAETKGAEYGGTVVIGAFGGIAALNPVTTRMTVAANVFDLLFVRLLEETETGEIAPGLAISWGASEDRRTWQFALRRDVLFHDGKPVTASDVAFTFGLLSRREGGQIWDLGVKGIEVVAVDTVRFRFLEPPVPSFLFKMRQHVLPRHVLEPELASGVELAELSLNRNPVGAGQFRLAEWRGDDEVVVTANEGYFGGRPFLDTVVVKAGYEDTEDLWAALMRGEVDVASHVPPKALGEVRKSEGYAVGWLGSHAYTKLTCNYRRGSVLSDPLLRQALDYAINRRAIWERIGGDRTAPESMASVSGPFLPGSVWNDPSVESPHFDPGRAAALLEEAGWFRDDVESSRQKDGRPLELMLFIQKEFPLFMAVAAQLRMDLGEVGIRLRVRAEPYDWLRSRSLLESERYDLLWDGGRFEFAPEACVSHWESGSDANLGGYSDEAVDRLIESGRMEYSQGARRDIYRRVHRKLAEDAPTLFICRYPSVLVVRKGLRGTELMMHKGLFRSLPDWYWLTRSN